MARESKRKRDGLRFGNPERLADKIWTSGWGIPGYITKGGTNLVEGYKQRCAIIVSDIDKSKVFCANNVRDYFASAKKLDSIDWIKDFPSIRLPFDFTFIEMDGIKDSAYSEKVDDNPVSWGLSLVSLGKDGMYPDGSAGIMHTYKFPETTHSLIAACLVDESRHGFICFGDASIIIPIDAMGAITAEPEFCANTHGKENGTWEREVSRLKILSAPIFMTLAFLNCKNTVSTEVSDAVQVNRERRRADLRPFVRYRTINIEPMKKVLRTEGKAETEGLKKALHICRGHFSTYTEEKPLFGRSVGTFWIPSHVRGSSKEGVVISDYKVDRP